MVKRTKITEADIVIFSWLLTKWSERKSSYYLRQFWRSVGMTEMQFYRRIWMAQVEGYNFNFDVITYNLKKNREHSKTLVNGPVKPRKANYCWIPDDGKTHKVCADADGIKWPIKKLKLRWSS